MRATGPARLAIKPADLATLFEIKAKIDLLYKQRDDARAAIRAALIVLDADSPAAKILATVDLEAQA